MHPQNNVRIFPNIETLSKAAADFVLLTALQAVKNNNSFSIVLSGGSTPEKLFTLLAKSPYREEMPWRRTHVFWGDERCVPLNDERNNADNAIKTLLSKVPIPTQNIHRIQTNLPPKEAAIGYVNELEAFAQGHTPSFDLVLLGMGDDGHTASLFPGTDVLEDQVSWVKEVYVPQQQMSRVTMMPHLINQAHNILFLVSGSNKSKPLADILSSSDSGYFYPAQLIKPTNGKMFWFIDEAAAAGFTS